MPKNKRRQKTKKIVGNKNKKIKISSNFKVFFILAIIFIFGVAAVVFIKTFSSVDELNSNSNLNSGISEQNIFKIRYDIVEDNIEYLNKNIWTDLPQDTIGLAGKNISYGVLRNSIYEFYYGPKYRTYREKILTLEPYGIIPIKMIDSDPRNAINKYYVAKEPYVYLESLKKSTDGSLGTVHASIFVSLKSEVSIIGFDGKSLLPAYESMDSEFSKIILAANTWRDSVFKKAIQIDKKRYCLQLMDQKYIQLDLANPVSGESC